MQALVNLFKGPGEAQAVLAHFQAGSSNAAGVGCFSGSEQDTVALQVSDCFRGRRHVSTFGNSVAAVGNQCLGTFQLQLVLGCAGQSDIAGNSPDALAALNVLSGGNVIQVSLDAGTLDFLDFLDDLVVNAVLVHDVAVGVAHGDNLAAHLGSFLVCIGSNIAGAGDDHTLALKALASISQHFLGKVAQAVAGSLGTGQGTAERDALAGQDAGVLVADALVLAKQEADLTAANADITGGHIGIGANVAVQLGHKALAEAHNFGVALAVGVKVRTALAAAHGQAGQAVLEALLKAQELEDRQVDRRMEAQAAFVGADGRVELHTVAAVDLHLAGVIHPRHTEHDDALRLNQALDQACLFIFRMGLNNGLQAFENFLNSLQEFLLLSIALCKALVHFVQISIFNRHGIHSPFWWAAVFRFRPHCRTP